MTIKEAMKTYRLLNPTSQEDLEKIPLLELEDISRDVCPYMNEETDIAGLPAVIHRYETNGIYYFNFCFDMSELPEELIPYATLLVDIFRYVDTDHYTYNELATEIGLKIGGVSFSTGIIPFFWKKEGYRPFFTVRAKCLEEQIPDAYNLIKEILFNSHLDDGK